MKLSHWLIVSGFLSLLIAVFPTSSAEINGIRELGTTSPQPQDMMEPDPFDVEEDAAAANVEQKKLEDGVSQVERLDADLDELSLEELREREEEIMRAITTQAEGGQDLMSRYQEARQTGREHDSIRAKQEEINQLRQQLEQAIDELPGVAEVLEELNENRRVLYELMELRSRIQRDIGIKEVGRTTEHHQEEEHVE